MTDLDETVTTILSALAAVHIIVQALVPTLSPLERWAAKTPYATDDKLVRAFASVVRSSAKALRVLETVLAPATKRRR